MTTKTQRMRCLRKQKEDHRQIKIFLLEISWHKFQTCLQKKTLDSKVNTMYDLFIQHHYLTYLHCVSLVKSTNTYDNYTLTINIFLTGYPSG